MHQSPNNMKIRLIIIALICVNSFSMFSQDGRRIEKDKQLWTEIKIEKEITKNLEAQLSHSLRWDENVSTLYRSFTQLTVGYDFTKWFTTKLGYRNAYGDEGYKRLIAIAAFDIDFKPWKIDWNNRFEYTKEKSEDEVDNTRIREKISLKYDNKKWLFAPSIYGEIFLPLGNAQAITDTEKIRYGMMIDVPLSKNHEIVIGTSIQDAYKKKKINRDLIFSIDYEFKF